MKFTNEADALIQRLGKEHAAGYLATVISLAERAAREEMCPRVATFHIQEAMEILADPMASDYPTLAAEEPTSQIEDCRDSAEMVGC